MKVFVTLDAVQALEPDAQRDALTGIWHVLHMLASNGDEPKAQSLAVSELKRLAELSPSEDVAESGSITLQLTLRLMSANSTHPLHDLFVAAPQKAERANPVELRDEGGLVVATGRWMIDETAKGA
jgi:hypothetical protein